MVVPLLDTSGNERVDIIIHSENDRMWLCDKCKQCLFNSFEDAVNHEEECEVHQDSYLHNIACNKSSKHIIILSPIFGTNSQSNLKYLSNVMDDFNFQMLQNLELFQNKSDSSDSRDGHVGFRCTHCTYYELYPTSISHMCSEEQLFKFYNHLIKSCPHVPPKITYKLVISSGNRSKSATLHLQYLKFCHHYFTKLGVTECFSIPFPKYQELITAGLETNEKKPNMSRVPHLEYNVPSQKG